MDILEGLNKEQRQAVEKTNGACLVIAGAGTGKTKVLTHKVAYLIEECGLYPSEILAFTFTNKAASEMKERIKMLIGTEKSPVWVGTFHSICVRILRKHIEKLGYPTSFNILDVPEQKTIVKQALELLGYPKEKGQEKEYQEKISKLKTKYVHEREIESYIVGYKDIKDVFIAYNSLLKQNGAIDFDDIINLTIRLLEEYEEVRLEYANKFRHVLVDEYQDTNTSQDRLISLLTSIHKNITVVGDNDQSIYSFRGAQVDNILNFENKFKGEVIKLEQNYRSTQKILDVANNIIDNSKYKKNLWSNVTCDTDTGVQIESFFDDREEAKYVVKKIKELVNQNYTYKDIAILYRVNSLSRIFETQFQREEIPFKIIGGFRFYERKEVKDALAYLKLIENTKDNLALLRIINEPKRGIGQKSLDTLVEISNNTGISIYDILKSPEEFNVQKISKKAENLLDAIDNIIQNKENLTLSEIYIEALEKTGYLSYIKELALEDTLEEERIKNLEELANIISEFEEEEIDGEKLSMQTFLEKVALETSQDNVENEEEYVTLMTVHTAKGLEYPVIFIVGVEQNTFPSIRSIEEGGMDEEKRLFYVAVTRAKHLLNISYSNMRSVFGKTDYKEPSEFITNIPEKMYEGSHKKAKEKLKKEARNANIFRDLGMNRSKYNADGDYVFYEKKGVYKPSSYTFESENKSPFRSADEFLNTVANKKTKINDNCLEIGDKVRHKKYGEGKIVRKIPENDITLVEVDFYVGGTRKFVEEYAKLEKI